MPSGKLRSAGHAVRKKRIRLLNLLSLTADSVEPDYGTAADLDTVLAELLEETTPAHYTGSTPPQRSYEQDIQGLELFAFAVESSRFECRVCFKSALEEKILWLVSLHQDRPMKEES